MDYISAIQAFVQVAKRESFSEASRDLGTTTSAVSRYVKELEKDIGAHLLVRTTRKVGLTESGKAFLLRAQLLLENFENLRNSAQALNAEPTGELRITAPVVLGETIIAPIIAEFMELYPKLSLSLNLTNQVTDLVSEGYDLGIRLATQLPDSSLMARQLAMSKTLLCASPNYCDKYGYPSTPEELRSHNCLVFRNDITAQWGFKSANGKTINIKVNGRLCINSGEAIRHATIGSAGIALLSSFLVKDDINNGKLQPLLTEYEPTPEFIYAVYPQQKFISKKVRCFIDFCVDKLSEC